MAETGRLVAFYGAGEPMRIEEYAVPESEPGAGGLGIFATATARELGAGRVIVVDGVQERLDLAAAFGADELIDLREVRTPEARAQRVRDLRDGWGADVVVEVAGVIGAMNEGLQMLGNGGRLVEIGNIVAGTSFELAR